MTYREEVRAFWRGRVAELGAAPDLSTPAVPMMERENRFVADLLRHRMSSGSRVLDVGCANGYSTACWSTNTNISVVGVDSCPEMIAIAREVFGIDARFADATDLPFDDGTFDCSIAKRTICNITDRAGQQRALQECMRVTRSGGIFILVDFFAHGYEQLHRLRRFMGLKEDVNRWHNLPLADEDVVTLGVRDRYPLGTMCYLIGYAVYPWVKLSLRRQPPIHTAAIHRIAARLPCFFRFGPLEAHVVRKVARA